jgi:hypothetical protein
LPWWWECQHDTSSNRTSFARTSAKLLKNGTLKTYKDFPHGMPTTQAEVINADLLAFIQA